MVVKKYLLSLLCITAGLSAGISNKTVIDTVPHVASSALTTLPLKLYLQERSNVSIFRGASMQVHLDYARSFKGGSYARMVSPFGKGSVEIASTSQAYTEMLNDFDFIHVNTLNHGIDALFNLNPHFEKTTANARLIFSLARWLPSFFIQIDATYSNLDYGVDAGLSGARTSRSIDGATVSITDYFAGKLTQKEDDTQSALTQALFGSKYNKKGVGDLSLLLGYKRILGKESFFSPYAKMTFAVNHERMSERFVDMHLSELPYHSFAVGCEALFRVSKMPYSDIFFGLLSEVGCVLPYTQKRTLGFKDQLLSPVPWSYFRLLAQNNATGVTPAANLLTKKLSISPRTFGSFGAVLDGRFSCLDIALGYQAHAFERESVSYADAPWNGNLYAVPMDNYNSKTTNFGGSGTFMFGDGNFISAEGLDFAPATAEGFIAHTINSSLSLSGVLGSLHLRIAGGGSFTFASAAVQQAWAASSGIFINF